MTAAVRPAAADSRRGTKLAPRDPVDRVRLQAWKAYAKTVWREMSEDRVTNAAAALAFYLVLAIFPAAIFCLSVLPYLPIPRLESAVLDVVREALPASAADMLTETVQAVLSKRSTGLISFGFLFTIWSASNGMTALMSQLDVVYDAPEERGFIRTRLVALTLAGTFFALVVSSLGLVVFGGVLQDFLVERLGGASVLYPFFAGLRYVIIVTAAQLGLSIVYWLGPNVRHAFKLWSPGTLFATAGLIVSSIGFKIYVKSFAGYDAVYGNLGAMIVLLMWFFIIGMVILIGGEINELAHRGKVDEAQKKRDEDDERTDVSSTSSPDRLRLGSRSLR